jgi:hypothetical protein
VFVALEMKRVSSPNSAACSPEEEMAAVGAFPNVNAQLYRAASIRAVESVKPSSLVSKDRAAEKEPAPRRTDNEQWCNVRLAHFWCKEKKVYGSKILYC